MRKSCQIIIYIDVQKALDSGLRFFLSTNGVVLSEGDENGFITPTYFKRVEYANRIPVPGWEGPAAEIHRVLTEHLPPIAAEALDQATEEDAGVVGAQTSDVASASGTSEHESSKVIEKLQNVELT
jgi:hypothetical protein